MLQIAALKPSEPHKTLEGNFLKSFRSTFDIPKVFKIQEKFYSTEFFNTHPPISVYETYVSSTVDLAEPEICPYRRTEGLIFFSSIFTVFFHRN